MFKRIRFPYEDPEKVADDGSAVCGMSKKNPKEERILFQILFRGYPFQYLTKQGIAMDIVQEYQDPKIFIWISQKISMDIKRYP